MRSIAPIHNSKSGFTGFFTKTGMSTPFRLSAIACIAKGLAEVRAPIQRMSTSYLRASSTCSGVATSVEMSMPVSSFTRFSHGSAVSPLPSKPPGLVRGFHTPARNILNPCEANWRAVVITCSSVSAEQGPAITNGRSSLPGKFNGLSSISIVMFIVCIRSSVYCQCVHLMRLILSSASSIFSSLAQRLMRTYLLPFDPKINPGVIKTRASLSTRSVSCSHPS